MDVCFFGVGGVGGYYAALLTRYFDGAGGGRTCFIARGEHKDAIIEKGLLLKKEGGKENITVRPWRCTDTVEGLPQFDIVVVSVKGYDLESAARDVGRITHDTSLILPLLNGADIHERMRQHLTKGYIFPTCLYLGTHIESPGVIFQKGGTGQISIGRDPGHPDVYPDHLMTLFPEAGIKLCFFDDVMPEIWTKFIFIASFALVTATFDKTINEAAQDKSCGPLVRSIMKEISDIAGALKIPLPEDIVETSFAKAGQFPFETRTSFQRDVAAKGLKSEWDLFGGTVLRYADALKLPAENTRRTFDQLMGRLGKP